MMDSRHVSRSLNVPPRNSLGAFDTSVRAAINDVIIDNLLCRTLNHRRMADNLEQSCHLDARFRSEISLKGVFFFFSFSFLSRLRHFCNEKQDLLLIEEA